MAGARNLPSTSAPREHCQPNGIAKRPHEHLRVRYTF
jgi:hypothetical protein